VSLAVAAAIFALARMALPAAYAPYAIFASLPFLVIGCVAGWKQLRAPSPEKISATLEAIRGLSWDEFSADLEAAFRRDGYAVTRLNLPGADLKLTKGVRDSVVSCKRWKVARTGVEPLRELDAARLSCEAHEGIYVAAGDVTDTARTFAAANNMRLLEGAELALLLPAARPRNAA